MGVPRVSGTRQLEGRYDQDTLKIIQNNLSALSKFIIVCWAVFIAILVYMHSTVWTNLIDGKGYMAGHNISFICIHGIRGAMTPSSTSTELVPLLGTSLKETGHHISILFP